MENNKITVYHGSEFIIEKPIYGKGSPYNDYGLGFYCTEHFELAKEWACKTSLSNGYANKYELDLNNLSVLDLTNKAFSILNWMAILVENRKINLKTPLAIAAQKYLIDNFLPDYKRYDVIVGYRADDSYFSFARSFLSNEISVEQLSRAMKLGNLGIQIVLKSEKAFNQIKFLNSTLVQTNVYYSKRLERDTAAKNKYLNELNNLNFNDLFLNDIIRGGITNDDPRLR